MADELSRKNAMLPVQFCNYNLDYQQRLGFLKLLVWVGENVRGGKEELQRRMESLYSPSARKSLRPKKSGAPSPKISATRSGRAPGTFDPEAMLQLDEIPSWQPGFSFQRLDRLVLWGEMLGLVTPTGRLAEWSKPLISDHPQFLPHAEEFPNPFLLSRRERAYFLALLMYHDHVLLHLTSALSQLSPGVRIETRTACIQIITALCRTLDCASGSNIQAVRTRQSLRDLLERLAGAEHVANRRALLGEPERSRALDQMMAKSTRNHLAEYHAICRFEQLTDLGLLVKENPLKPPSTVGERDRTRKSWVWYTTDAIKSFGPCVQSVDCDVERYLQKHWAKSCFAGQCAARELEAGKDQEEIAALLDAALPRARRQLGAIQVHTWVFIAALDAIDRGLVLEFEQAYRLLDAMRHDQRYSGYIRQSGQETYLGRTALVMSGTMADHVSRYPIATRGPSND
jgi:hypothetical protein